MGGIEIDTLNYFQSSGRRTDGFEMDGKSTSLTWGLQIKWEELSAPRTAGVNVNVMAAQYKSVSANMFTISGQSQPMCCLIRAYAAFLLNYDNGH